MSSKAASIKEGSTPPPASSPPENPHANRETVESIIVAVILAFLFRGFVAEAFVIPTGSMAPTLQGNHKDLQCIKCGYWYRAGASIENDDMGARYRQEVARVTCPICRYETEIDHNNLDHATFSGDRIVVSKFSYLISDPKRWDVIVFKFPGNAKQNYIKRLIGLPNEEIRIRHGDIFVKGPNDPDFHIARKPEYRQKAMLQLVDDTQYVSSELTKAGWPSRWSAPSENSHWKEDSSGQHFSLNEPTSEVDWIRYRHLVPTHADWAAVTAHRVIHDASARQGELISDFYAYNSSHPSKNGTAIPNWVGDLAVECDVEVKSGQGDLLIDLVEGGTHYTCTLDVATGLATLSIDGGRGEFSGEGKTGTKPKGQTVVKGPGKYQFRLSNMDDEVRFWVNEKLVTFDLPTTYQPSGEVAPKWSPEDPGDLLPAGVGSLNVAMEVENLRILRDVYYIATEGGRMSDYNFYASDIMNIFREPTSWQDTNLFASRRSIQFKMEDDQYFPCGDNSPESRDARIWNVPYNPMVDVPNSVSRDQLTGEALMVYYPHPWTKPFRVPTPWGTQGLTPNFKRMGLIR